MVRAISREGSHFYRVNGIEIPSVTTILKPLSPYFNEKPSTNDNNTFKNIYANIGTHIHFNILKQFDKIDPPEEELPNIPWVTEKILNSMKQWNNFVKDHEIEVHAVEQFVYSGGIYPFAGRLDMICDIDGKRCILDIKTGNEYEYYDYQLAAYWGIAKSDKLITDGILLYIYAHPKKNPDNIYREVWYDIDELNKNNYYFMCYAKDWYDSKNGPKVI
ncbi:MAG: PD-(D/E)XK nuclease family protein [Dehalococcoidales bacterium]|jgi:hypothetical protein